ncbi:LTXXQ motif family protein [Malonomonas rubra DSM 5091]|uniref:LTXXQ motif family protein n=1 Tax=Malonomonas rubra DSM 5091 TaxID=1122189 RepID=A0A1M6IPD7_MALRU|nr:Spy/CpxP family protein refolding chaperone [Malonomonas rubra]SHJ36278.1 LTXXQ motif family protein [Malonomonas rubra DSM 5091]
MKKRIMIPSLLIGALMTASLAIASPGFGGKFGRGCDGDCAGRSQGMSYEQHEERMGQRLEMMAAVLDLSEDQQSKIKALMDQQWQNRQGDREEMQAAREAMREARQADPFNEADFRAKAETMNALKTERMIERAKLQADIKAVLTPEQQEKAETLRGMMGFGKKGKRGGARGGCRS